MPSFGRFDGGNLGGRGNSKDGGPYEAILASIPARDTAGAFLDVSGRLAHMVPESGNTGAFGAAGYMSSVAAVNGGVSLTPGKLDWTPASESLMLAFEINQAAPAAALTILGVGGRNVAGECGFYLSLRQTPAPAGRIKIVSFIESTLYSNTADSVNVFADGTPRHGVLLWDCVAGQFSLFARGVLDHQYTPSVQYPAGMKCRADGGSVRVGGLPGNTVAAVPAVIGAMHVCKWTGSPPVGVLRAIAKLAELPRAPISSVDF